MFSPVLVLFFLFFLLSTVTTLHGSPENTTICPETLYSCGNLPDIRYPFSIVTDLQNSALSSFCGYPGLTLVCREEKSILYVNTNTSVHSYIVQEIDYTSNTFNLIDNDLLQSPICPRVYHNFTLDVGSFLDYTDADINLTFFFNCSDGPEGLEHVISCLSDSTSGNRSYVFMPDAVFDGYDFYGRCAETMVVPVLHDEHMDDLKWLTRSFGVVIGKGFQLRWDPTASTDGCRRCEKSGGRCGFTVTSSNTTAFTCFCEDGLHQDCDHSDRIRKKIIIGVCAGVGGFLLACALCFLFYKCKRRQKRSSSLDSLIEPSYTDSASRRDPELGSPTYPTHFFSYQELQEATEGFNASKELGDGGYGAVYKGELRDGRTVAIKRLYDNNYKRVEQYINEVKILSCLRHQNLVTLYGCTSPRTRELLLVYEYLPNGTVADHLHGRRAHEGNLSWPVRMTIAIETADALAYLHAVEPPIIHRDVKTNNILLDSSFHAKVADFGLSRFFPTDATHVSTAPQGTPGYVDPEYHQCYQLTNKSDVYSFGVVLVELISSKPAVDISRPKSEINLANMAIHVVLSCELDRLVDPRLGCQSDARVQMMVTQVAELAFRCLQGDREMRPTIKEVLEALRGIESGVCKEKVAEEPNEKQTVKTTEPFSPDSVVDKWASRESTPNVSG